jgi:DNA polymerase III delta prime subunit
LTVELWTEKYRSQTLDEYVWRDSAMREKVEEWLAEGALPHLLLTGKTGTGKAQPLDANILTPEGWVEMGSLCLGQKILTPKGNPTTVIGIYPQGEKEVYKVHFKDGRVVECCAEHLWEVSHSDWKDRIRVLPTDALMDKLSHLDKCKSNHRLKVRLINQLEFGDAPISLPIPPYALGCLLGDGSLCRDGSIRFSTADAEMLTYIRESLGDNYELNQVSQYDHRIIVKTGMLRQINEKGSFRNPLKIALDDLGLLGKKSPEKFIPDIYKNADFESRISILQGLLDTDGSVSKQNEPGGGGTVNFYSSSEQLAKDVQYLVWSIGGTAAIAPKQTQYTYDGMLKDGLPSFIVTIKYPYPRRLMKLSRKLERCAAERYFFHKSLANVISKIEATGVMKPMQCIMVDDPEHLYITNDFIPTHNTTLALLMLKLLNIPDVDILYINASRERRVDDIQDRIGNFVSTWAMGDSGIKYILLDEFDAISPLAQKMLRADMETYADVTRFIATANYSNKIIEPLLGRFHVMHFETLGMDEYTVRVGEILNAENVDWDFDDLEAYVKVTYPNLRKCISLVQHNTIGGKLTPPGSNDAAVGEYMLNVIDLFKKGKFIEARKMIVGHAQVEDYPQIFTLLYKNLDLFGATQDEQDDALIIISKGVVNHSSAFDPEINLSATLCEICRLKKDK